MLTLIGLFVLFWLPGFVVWVQQLFLLKKLGFPDVVWETLSPFTFLFVLIIVHPLYTFGLLTTLAFPKNRRKEMLLLSLTRSITPDDTPERIAEKITSIYAIAKLARVKMRIGEVKIDSYK